jgi:uncharacterized protein (UPF0332 family)
MSIHPNELFDLAKELEAKGSEICYRAAIGRAYYCAYHVLRPIMSKFPEVKPSRVEGRLEHQEVARRLQHWGHPNPNLQQLKHAAKVVERALRAAILAREKADYLIDQSVSADDAARQLRRSSDLVYFAQRILKIDPSLT